LANLSAIATHWGIRYGLAVFVHSRWNRTMSQTRHAGGRWIPGISGNPNGRPKVIAQVRDAARALTPKALERLEHLMDSFDEKIALAAVQEALSRGWGKPETSLAVTTNEKPPEDIRNKIVPGMTAQQCADAYAEMIKRTH
jgi:hypothetical protein